MGVFDRLHVEMDGWPVVPVGPLAAYARPILQHMLGPRLTEREIRERMARAPADEARIGQNTAEYGRRIGDDELYEFGSAMVVAATVRVVDQSSAAYAPPKLAEEVAGYAASLPPDELARNRFVSEPDAQKTLEVVEETGRIPKFR